MITLLFTWMWVTWLDPPGTLTLFRTKEYWGSGYQIRINGEVILESFKAQQVVSLPLPPGTYWVESKKFDSQTSRLRVDIKSGQRVYIRGIEDNDFLLKALHLRPWAEDKAMPMLGTLKKQNIPNEKLDRLVAQ